MFWQIALVLFILWIFGFGFKVGGNLIHTLAVIALILLMLQFLF
ncbi:MAG: lmo0937 family membrane protein [Patescibacteria group bacterium]